MTGYAAVRSTAASGELQFSLRSVNHRALDLHFHLGASLAPFENAMRAALKESIGRGHVEIRAHWSEDASSDVAVDRAVLKSYVHELLAVGGEFGIDADPDLSAMLNLPGVVVSRQSQLPKESVPEQEVLEQFGGCIRQMNACREREGAALLEHILSELTEIEKQTNIASTLRADCVAGLQDAIRERLSALLAGTSVSENRILEEAAVLTDRSDVQEELTRLTVHSAELRRMLEAGGEVGKRIDFLLQEMNRESNTLLSKSSTAGDLGLRITNVGLELKARIEKIREQALNLE